MTASKLMCCAILVPLRALKFLRTTAETPVALRLTTVLTLKSTRMHQQPLACGVHCHRNSAMRKIFIRTGSQTLRYREFDSHQSGNSLLPAQQ